MMPTKSLPTVFGSFVVLSLLSLWNPECLALSSRMVVFPMKSQYKNLDIVRDQLTKTFHEILDSSEFFEKTESDPAVYKVPALGEEFQLSFGDSGKVASYHHARYEGEPDDLVLHVKGTNQDDFAWIFRKVYDHREAFLGIDMTNLREAVFMDVNPLTPPHPGYDAESARLAQTGTLERILNSVPGKTAHDHLQELQINGFVVVDNTIATSKDSNDMLGQYLWHKTGQGDEIRTDTVSFLSRDDAVSCGLGVHFDVLMGLASYLNHNLHIPPSVALPISPASYDKPLTIPEDIQAAEYGKGGFYVAHSDNSWAMGKHLETRNNYRSYTAILYCNDDWAPSDGGALRIYKDSTLLANVQDACNLCDYTDVFPKNGRLVIFDSSLVHAVRKVKSDKVRRALTVWLTQPTDCGILGEIIDVPL